MGKVSFKDHEIILQLTAIAIVKFCENTKNQQVLHMSGLDIM